MIKGEREAYVSQALKDAQVILRLQKILSEILPVLEEQHAIACGSFERAELANAILRVKEGLQA